jgi:hypothetical protein
MYPRSEQLGVPVILDATEMNAAIATKRRAVLPCPDCGTICESYHDRPTKTNNQLPHLA